MIDIVPRSLCLAFSCATFSGAPESSKVEIASASSLASMSAAAYFSWGTAKIKSG